MDFRKVIKKIILIGFIVFNFVGKAYGNNTEVADASIAPLEMNNESSLVLTENAHSIEYKQVWYSIRDESVSSIDDKENSISIIKYLDKDYAVDEFQKLIDAQNIKTASRLSESVEFCGYRVQKLKGMTEDSIFIYLGINESYFMMMGKKALLFKALDINKYCDICAE